MDKQYKVGVVGATGMVGQRFVTLLENHPWFKLTTLAASGRSAGKTYEEAVGSRWAMTTPMPESVKKMVVLDASKVEEVASQVDFIFCAVNMPKDEIKALEEAYAKAECPVVSNNSANRFTPDVPMVVPEINADHIDIIPAQRKRLGTKRGFIAVKSNCSLQSYVPALHPLMKDGSTLENAIARERELLASAPPKTGDAYDDQELEHRYARIAELRSREMQLQTELDALRAKGRPELTADNLARIIELWTKIPAASIRADEFEQLAGLGDRLRAHIVGQDAAIDTVCAAIRRNRVGLQAKRKPVSFLFVGGTGVGKTELVKRLADELFHAPESLIRLDMSEFMEKFSVSRMIGSPPGYVGYDEAGQLTEKIRRRPYSVVLFDEIEKAHPDVMNLLLQILDDGRITDAQGRTVNFENTVIILTTNAGSNTRTGTLGFGLSADDQSRERAQRALNEFLRPEFLNRLDEIVYFNHLTEENFRAIASLMLGEVRTAMAERGMTLHWTPAVIDYLVAKGYSETYGARNLRRTIQRDVEDAIASAVVAQRKAAGDVAIDAQNDRIVVTIDGKEVTA